MELRDTNMDAAYFKEYIAWTKKQIETITAELTSTDDSEQIRRTSSWLAMYCNDLIFAKYSAGYPVEDLKPLFSRLVAAKANGLTGKPNPYYLIFPYYSLAVLLGPSDEDRDALQRLSDAIEGADSSADFLAGYLGLDYGRHATESKWKYFNLVSALDTKEAKEVLTAEYLKRQWYNSHRWREWWGDHKSTSGVYKGYWAIDIAAAAKAYGLDDASFRDHRYYPRDLADFSR